jgi:phage nucleotide-binding protein
VTTPDQLVQWMNMFIYGDPGVGKTRLVATAQDHEETAPLLIVDIEGGQTTNRKRTDIEVVEIRSLQQLQNLQQELYKEGDDLSETYRTVALDNLSELQSLDMKLIMAQAKATARDPDKVDIDVPSQREWGKSREHMRAIVRSFRDLPCHTIMTAHTVTEKNEGQPDRYFPGFGGRSKTDVPGFMDIVGYMTVDMKGPEPVRRIQFGGTRRVLAKDRTDTLGITIENPTIPLIWEKIHASA